MSFSSEKQFIEALLSTLIETVQKQDRYFQRGLITDAERIEETNAILSKTAELLQAL